LSREFKIHDNLLLLLHFLLLLSCIVTHTIQPAVVVSGVKILVVEFSLWCSKELSAVDLSNGPLPNVLSHGVFWELLIVVVAEQIVIVHWSRVLILSFSKVDPVLSAAFLLNVVIFIVVVFFLGLVRDDGTCYAARLIQIVVNWRPVNVCADRSC